RDAASLEIITTLTGFSHPPPPQKVAPCRPRRKSSSLSSSTPKSRLSPPTSSMLDLFSPAYRPLRGLCNIPTILPSRRPPSAQSPRHDRFLSLVIPDCQRTSHLLYPEAN